MTPKCSVMDLTKFASSKNGKLFYIFGLFPPSGILENRKHDVSETGSVSVLRCLLPLHLRKETSSF
jgi:hypothetical protein